MKALVCSSLTGYKNLSLQQLAEPTPAADEVLVDVVAAALNFPDLLIVAGKYQLRPELPFIAGGEAAGIVATVGSEVTSFKPGDRVALVGSVGAFAEKAVRKEHELIRIPDSMSLEHAAGFCVAYGTSYYALKQCGNVQPGESVLVLGAAGGVGLAAVDIARALGAYVIAAASSDDKLAKATEVGASQGIRYDKGAVKEQLKSLTEGRGVDVVLDPVGGDVSEQALRAMAWKGRYLVVGFAAGDIPSVPLNIPLLKNCTIAGVLFGGWAQRSPADSAKNFAELFDMVETGRLQPAVSESYALNDFRNAYACLAERRAQGKIILRIQEDRS